ncbi:type III effector protein [Escherichia coli]|uniref:type III effector protein n=1 Tax=Enterobacteriaceae TaxID=543 RepID=UPI000B953F0E|nr:MULTISPECIES: type III effector protein [Enterobacteriaceae]OYL32221.1 type III effector protein [Shigella sonnei]MBN6612607.1 type III effector protein [Escherichia coli]MED8082872.1 type III effector protein [Escherichia coli]OYJ41986.1 type III effector protein [Shigella boydii]HAG7743184.1 type III effector protein [Escherichia coli]
MSVGNEEKYSITHKDITNLITGDRQSFLKLTLWEFILDLFPMYHIKEAKETIVEFVTKTEDKVKRFERIKYLAIPEEKWRFSATTEFTVDENKDIIVSRVFKININSKDHHNEAEENKIHSVFSEVLSLDIYKHDIQFDEKALQSGILKMQFPNDNEKLSVYLKNKIPFENMTIDLSALKKDVLVSLKQCHFKNMTFTGNISYENLNGPVFENCFFDSCNFENVSLVGFDKVTCESYDVLCNVRPNNKIPIYGMFKGCFLYQCEMKNFKIETSKIYSINQDPQKGGKKVGAYLFMQSFVYESNLQDGDCKEASVIASGLLSCKIAKLNGAGMDFIETSFYRNTRDRFSNSNNFYDCNFRDVNMTCKRDGIREDLRDYDPRKYFGKSENKLNLDKHLLDVIQENIFQNMKTHYNINDDIDNHLELSNCCLYGACLGELTGGNPLHDCAINLYTRLSGNLAANTQVKIPVYMSYRGAIAENDILPFMKKLTNIYSRIEDINEHSDNLKNNYKKALADLQSLLVNLHNIMPGDDVKDFQLNDETIKYIIDNVLYNRKKDIASEIDTNKVNFMQKIYNNLDWYRRFDENGKIKTYRSINPNGNRFYFDFNDLQFLYYDHERKNGHKVEDFVKMQNVFLTVKNFKAEEKINQEQYTEKPADVAREIASFFDIEQYLLGVIDDYYNYINEVFTYKMKDLANLSDARNTQLKIKLDLDGKKINLNDNDIKGKGKIQNEIEEIDEEIKKIDEAIRVLNNEIESFKLNYEPGNILNDVIIGISRWLKENKNMVEAIKGIFPEVINKNIENIDKTV